MTFREPPAASGSARSVPRAQRPADHVLGQPRIGEPGLDGRQRDLDAADRVAPLRAEPSFVARVLHAGVAHDDLRMMGEIRSRERVLDLEQRVIRACDRDERNVEEIFAEKPRRHARGDDHVREALDDRFLRSRQHGIGEPQLRVRAEPLQLRDDVEQPLARKRRVDDEAQLRFPALLDAAREELECLDIP